MWFLAKLVSWPIIGPFLKLISNAVLTWQKQKLDAEGAHEIQVATVAERAIQLDQREAELNNQILIAEQGNWLTRSVRPLLAMPVIIIVWKLLVWDKALGQWTNGTTDRLDDHMWWVITTIIVAYMGGRTVEKVADKLVKGWR
jgi:hypothetical protein